MTIYGFYRKNKLVYVGQTINKVDYRISKHYSDAKKNKNSSMLIVRAIAKYGANFFTWKVICECTTMEELNQKESEYISKFNPRYNIRPGGYNAPLALSTRKKISEFQKKKILCVDDQICFYSVIECEQFYNAAKGTIGRVAKGLRNSYNNKKFEFINTVS